MGSKSIKNFPKISIEQHQTLIHIYRNNGTNNKELLKTGLYSSRNSAFRALNDLKDKGFVLKVDAPKSSDAHKMYILSDNGTEYLALSNRYPSKSRGMT